MVIIVATTTEEIKEAFAWLTENSTDDKIATETILQKPFANRTKASDNKKLELKREYSVLHYAKSGNIYYVDKIPKEPGVYCFFDEFDVLMYVGSSKKLSQRIPQSFFERSKITNIDNIAYITTDSEEDARSLEAYFIGNYKPTLNVIKPFICPHYDANKPNPFELVRHSIGIWKNNTEDWGEF